MFLLIFVKKIPYDGRFYKYFFQTLSTESQQTYFRIFWYKNSNVIDGELEAKKIYLIRMSNVISYLYIACREILETNKEDSVNVNIVTIQTIKERMHMDDLLFSMDTLEEAQTVATNQLILFQVVFDRFHIYHLF